MISLLFLMACNGSKELGTEQEAAVPLMNYVDPMIATGGIGYGVNCGFPGATNPLGLVKFSPDTATASGGADGYYRGGGYHYDDVQIQGFSLMHLYATGITGHGTLATMPADGFSLEQTTRDGYALPFNHEQEYASIGRYAVELPIADVEIRASDHTGLIQYQFHDSENPVILLDVAHRMGNGAVTDATISIAEDGQSFTGSLMMDGEMGHPYPIYFYGTIDTPPLDFGLWKGNDIERSTRTVSQEMANEALGAYFSYSPESTVHMRIALSNVDADGAYNNYLAEVDIDEVYDLDVAEVETLNKWSTYFDAIQVWGGEERDWRIFATALYHSLQMPTLYSDVDGRYLGFDGEIHHSERPFYSDFSLWDTYRTTHPLYTLLWPDTHEDLLWSLVQMSLQGNGLPRWPLANSDTGVMLGTGANIVIAEALLKGLSNFGEAEWVSFAMEAMLGQRSLDFGAAPDIETFTELGYYPADEVGRSVAWTQEQAISDYALGTLLLEQGFSEGTIIQNRGRNWQKLWDTEVGFFHGRNRDGSFQVFSVEDQWSEDYAEGNARQYLWLAPHDSTALFETLGGEDESLRRLNQFFDMMIVDEILAGLPERWYWHGNEPTLHVPYNFYLLDEAEKGDQWIQWLLDNRYSDGPVGLAGNDDGGTLSAWAIFAMMGLYPIAGTTDYILGTPVWDRVEINNGREVRSFQLIEGGNERSHLVQGQKWTSPIVQHSALQSIEFNRP